MNVARAFGNIWKRSNGHIKMAINVQALHDYGLKSSPYKNERSTAYAPFIK